MTGLTLLPAPLEEVALTELVVVLALVCEAIAGEVVAIVDAAVALVEPVAIDEEVPESVALGLAELAVEAVVDAAGDSVVDIMLVAGSERLLSVVTKSSVQYPGPSEITEPVAGAVHPL